MLMPDLKHLHVLIGPNIDENVLWKALLAVYLAQSKIVLLNNMSIIRLYVLIFARLFLWKLVIDLLKTQWLTQNNSFVAPKVDYHFRQARNIPDPWIWFINSRKIKL